jgi:hypothetical protein
MAYPAVLKYSEAMIKALFASSLAWVLLAGGANAQLDGKETVTFGCDAPANQACYFAVYLQKGAVLTFNLPGGGRRVVPGVWPGHDRYQVAINHATPGDFAKCQNQVGGWCKVAFVAPGYNN